MMTSVILYMFLGGSNMEETAYAEQNRDSWRRRDEIMRTTAHRLGWRCRCKTRNMYECRGRRTSEKNSGHFISGLKTVIWYHQETNVGRRRECRSVQIRSWASKIQDMYKLLFKLKHPEARQTYELGEYFV